MVKSSPLIQPFLCFACVTMSAGQQMLNVAFSCWCLRFVFRRYLSELTSFWGPLSWIQFWWMIYLSYSLQFAFPVLCLKCWSCLLCPLQCDCLTCPDWFHLVLAASCIWVCVCLYTLVVCLFLQHLCPNHLVSGTGNDGYVHTPLCICGRFVVISVVELFVTATKIQEECQSKRQCEVTNCCQISGLAHELVVNTHSSGSVMRPVISELNLHFLASCA